MLNKLKSVEAEFRPKMHKALFFDGKDDYVVVHNSNSLKIKNTLTLILWINVEQQLYPWSYVLTKNTWATSNYMIIIDTEGDIGFGIGDGTHVYYIRVGASGNLLKKGWTMITCKYDGKNEMIYYNTTKMVESPDVQITPYISDIDLLIGATRFYRGLIGYVRIYNRALRESEIKYLYNNPLNQLDKEHIVLDLTPASIDIANSKWWDLSGKGNHGTIYGATEVKLTKPEVSVK